MLQKFSPFGARFLKLWQFFGGVGKFNVEMVTCLKDRSILFEYWIEHLIKLEISYIYSYMTLTGLFIGCGEYLLYFDWFGRDVYGMLNCNTR